MNTMPLNKNSSFILLTGGAGYIGSHTYLELFRNKFTPIIVDNFSNSYPAVIKKLEKLTKKEVLFEKGNIKCKSFINFIFQKYSIEGVIHFAALKSIPESYTKSQEYFDCNVNGTKNILENLIKHKSNFFIFSSSASIYSPFQSLPFTEKSKTSSSNPYALTKLQAEKLIKDFSKKIKNLNI